VKSVIDQRLETVFLIKRSGPLRLRPHLDGNHADLLRDAKCAFHGVEQQYLPQTLAPNGMAGRETPEVRNRNGVARQPAAERLRHIGELEAPRRQRVVPDDAERAVRHGDIGATESPVLILSGVLAEVLIQRRLAAIERVTLVVPRESFDDERHVQLIGADHEVAVTTRGAA
jgi:hypothetical protein